MSYSWDHTVYDQTVYFPCGSDGKSICLQCGRPGFDPWGWEDPLEKEMATHSSILAWKIPWTEEPGRLYRSWSCKELDTTEWLHFTIQYIAFSDWLLLFSNMHLSLLSVFSWFYSSFLFSVEWYTIAWMYHSLKNILFASKFWRLQMKLLWKSVCRF